jgi:hypothetical protein
MAKELSDQHKKIARARCNLDAYYPPIAAAMRAKGYLSPLELRLGMEELAQSITVKPVCIDSKQKDIFAILRGKIAYNPKHKSQILGYMLLISALLDQNPNDLFPAPQKRKEMGLTPDLR